MKSETVLVRKLAVGGIVSLLLLAGCGGGTSQSINNQPVNNQPPAPTAPTTSGGPNPVPTINYLYPNCAPAGEPVQLEVVGPYPGSNFVTGSVVRWNGSDRPTTSVLS